MKIFLLVICFFWLGIQSVSPVNKRSAEQKDERAERAAKRACRRRIQDMLAENKALIRPPVQNLKNFAVEEHLYMLSFIGDVKNEVNQAREGIAALASIASVCKNITHSTEVNLNLVTKKIPQNILEIFSLENASVQQKMTLLLTPLDDLRLLPLITPEQFDRFADSFKAVFSKPEIDPVIIDFLLRFVEASVKNYSKSENHMIFALAFLNLVSADLQNEAYGDKVVAFVIRIAKDLFKPNLFQVDITRNGLFLYLFSLLAQVTTAETIGEITDIIIPLVSPQEAGQNYYCFNSEFIQLLAQLLIKGESGENLTVLFNYVNYLFRFFGRNFTFLSQTGNLINAALVVSNLLILLVLRQNQDGIQNARNLVQVLQRQGQIERLFGVTADSGDYILIADSVNRLARLLRERNLI